MKVISDMNCFTVGMPWILTVGMPWIFSAGMKCYICSWNALIYLQLECGDIFTVGIR